MTPRKWGLIRHGALLLFAAFIFGLLGVALVRGLRPDPPQERAAIRAGLELVMVFLGTSTCGASRTPGLEEALDGIRTALRQEALERGISFVSLGVSADWVIADGLAFLDRFGPFDEIFVGRKNLNTGMLKFLWQDLPGPPIYPQVLVLERQVMLDPSYGVSGERARVRKAGASSIIAWSRMLQANSRANDGPDEPL